MFLRWDGTRDLQIVLIDTLIGLILGATLESKAPDEIWCRLVPAMEVVLQQNRSRVIATTWLRLLVDDDLKRMSWWAIGARILREASWLASRDIVAVRVWNWSCGWVRTSLRADTKSLLEMADRSLAIGQSEDGSGSRSDSGSESTGAIWVANLLFDAVCDSVELVGWGRTLRSHSNNLRDDVLTPGMSASMRMIVRVRKRRDAGGEDGNAGDEELISHLESTAWRIRLGMFIGSG